MLDLQLFMNEKKLSTELLTLFRGWYTWYRSRE